MGKSDEWEIVAGGSEVLRVTALDDEGNPIGDGWSDPIPVEYTLEGEVLSNDNPFTIRSTGTPLKINPNTTTAAAAGITFAGSANTNIFRVGGVVNPQLNLPEDFDALKQEVVELRNETADLRNLVGEMWGMIVDLTAIVDTKADSRRGRGQTQPRNPGLTKEVMMKELEEMAVAISKKGKSNG